MAAGGSVTEKNPKGKAAAGAAAAAQFPQLYVASYADAFAPELEALADSSAPAPPAVLRRCILAQAALYSAPYQRLAVAAGAGAGAGAGAEMDA